MANILLTGASSGIGAAAARELTRLGHSVIATGRSAGKLKRVYDDMRRAAPEHVSVPAPIPADFASLAEVRRVACTVGDRWRRLDVLINNAGLEAHRRSISHDGIELVFAVNHLAPFLLTRLLTPQLTYAHGRVITTSSSNHLNAHIDLTDLTMTEHWTPHEAYARSKLANILFTVEFRRRTGLAAATFHPGSIRTALNRDAPHRWAVRPYEALVYRPPSRGADTMVWLATSYEGAHPSGTYYVRRAVSETAYAVHDRALARALWDRSDEIISRHNRCHLR